MLGYFPPDNPAYYLTKFHAWGIRELITMIEADSLEEWSEEHEYE